MISQKHFIAAALTASVLMVAPTETFAAGPSDNANANVNAKVIKPVRITTQADMDFGEVLTSASAGTVVLATDGTVSGSGGAYVFDDTNAQAAAFRVSGEGLEAYNITLPTSVTLTEVGGGSMSLNGFNHDATGVLANNGQEDFNVGATLNVGAEQAQGDYTGSFTVSVDYP